MRGMKASELIAELQSAIALHGDGTVTVAANPPDFLTASVQVRPMHGVRYLADDQADDRYGTHDAVYPGEDLPDDPRLEPVILITTHTKE